MCQINLLKLICSCISGFIDVNITDKAITPEHPQSNAVVENFNRCLNKCLRIAKVQNSPWQNELRKMLLNYRNSVHSTTNVTPAQ